MSSKNVRGGVNPFTDSDDAAQGADNSRSVPRPKRGIMWHWAIRRPVQATCLILAVLYCLVMVGALLALAA